MDRRKLIDSPERRNIAASDFELRSDGGDSLKLDGYASLFDTPYDVMGGPNSANGWSEIVDKRAFDVTLGAKPDVHLLINHEGMPLARTKSGTLKLSTDNKGLRVLADLHRRDPDVQRLETKMQRGDMDQMSFAFRVKRDQWTNNDTERRLTEVSLNRGDVSVVNFGASPTTSAKLSMRSVIGFLANVSPEEASAELRSMDDPTGDIQRAYEALMTLRSKFMPGKTVRSLSLAEARAVALGDAELQERADQGNITDPDSGSLNAAARKYAASQGWAMLDGSYPIRPANMHGAQDLAKAIRAVGRGGASHDAIRKHIMKRARAIGMSDAIPTDWNADGSVSE